MYLEEKLACASFFYPFIINFRKPLYHGVWLSQITGNMQTCALAVLMGLVANSHSIYSEKFFRQRSRIWQVILHLFHQCFIRLDFSRIFHKSNKPSSDRGAGLYDLPNWF